MLSTSSHVQPEFNKRMLLDRFSAALQTSENADVGIDEKIIIEK